jgi:hypothetical protein
MKNNKVKVAEKDIKEIAYDRRKEKEIPNIVIDTNIWVIMTQAQRDDLRQFNDHYGFKYFFSSINCIETFVRLYTHFEQQKRHYRTWSIYVGRIFYYQKICFSERSGS